MEKNNGIGDNFRPTCVFCHALPPLQFKFKINKNGEK